MNEGLRHLKGAAAGVDAHCRSYQKADGRFIHLYGYAPHSSAPEPEDKEDVAKGGELRWHPFRQEWIVYAAHRQNRTFKPAAADDPLAPTTPGGPTTEIPFTDFELAIFENKFTSLHRNAPEPAPIDRIRSTRALGHCDVVVYTPEATGSLHTIGQAKRRLLIAAWNDRYDALFAQGRQFVYPFENRGDEVGVTLPHPHGQVYAFDYTPSVQAKAAEAFAQGYSLSEDIKAFETDFSIDHAGGMVAFCPPYARFPYEVWIAPTEQSPGPWAFNPERADGFAHLLGDVCRRYDAFFQRPTAYMLALHAAPRGTEDRFHFTAQFYPLLRAPDRVKFLASVEQGTGAFTVDVMPDDAAKVLRAQ